MQRVALHDLKDEELKEVINLVGEEYKIKPLNYAPEFEIEILLNKNVIAIFPPIISEYSFLNSFDIKEFRRMINDVQTKKLKPCYAVFNLLNVSVKKYYMSGIYNYNIWYGISGTPDGKNEVLYGAARIILHNDFIELCNSARWTQHIHLHRLPNPGIFAMSTYDIPPLFHFIRNLIYRTKLEEFIKQNPIKENNIDHLIFASEEPQKKPKKKVPADKKAKKITKKKVEKA